MSVLSERDTGKTIGVRTTVRLVLYVMEKDADRSALMHVEFLSFTSRVTA